MPFKFRVIISILLILSIGSFAQIDTSLYKKIYFPFDTTALYIGDVDGVTAKEYKKIRFGNNKQDKEFGLNDLTKSTYPIELRLYEEPSGGNLIRYYYCTRIYFDTIFKIDRKRIYKNSVDTIQRVSIEDNPIQSLKADSIFKLFADSNIFSIPNFKNIRVEKAVLFNNQISASKITGLAGCPHCPSYWLEFKVGDIFNNIILLSYFNPYSNTPNNNEFLRKKEIIMNALRTRSHIELKK